MYGNAAAGPGLHRDTGFVTRMNSHDSVSAGRCILLMSLLPATLPLMVALSLCLTGCCRHVSLKKMNLDVAGLALDYDSSVDAAFQKELVAIDAALREKLGMTAGQTAAGVLDLRTGRLAMINPDKMDYAASVPKIAILLAYFQQHPEAATAMDARTRHELGLMIKVSDNVMATKYSRPAGLKQIQEVLNDYHFYDAQRGGLWMGKHYGKGGERYGDPLSNHSHAATVRQLLRFYLLLEQGRLVSPAASRAMREIFASPDIAHREDKFVKGLKGRDVEVLRKAGWWEDWAHDTAVVTGAGRHYIIVAMTHHSAGDAYLEGFAEAMDEVMMRGTGNGGT
jgi:beta-lactamase class A